MKSFWWWLSHPHYYLKLLQRNRAREALGLRLIPYLSKAEQAADNSTPTKKIVAVVRAVERGDAIVDHDALQLWAQAQSDASVQQLADDLTQLSQANFAEVSTTISAKQLRQLRRDTLNRIEFESLSITPHLPVLIPLVSAFFLFSGYIHTAILFSKFEVEFSRYFGLSDYIAASMESLISVIIATTLAILMMSVSRKAQRLNALQRQLMVNNGGTIFGMTAVFVAFMLMRNQLQSDEYRSYIVYAILITVGTSGTPFISAYAKRPNATLLFSIFVVMYGSLLWLMTNTELQQLSRPSKTTVAIVLNDGTTIDGQRVIAGNSLYLFLLAENKEVSIIPIENIKQIHYAGSVSKKLSSTTATP